MGASFVAAAQASLAVGQILMLETQPDVAECAIVALGHGIPDRPACRAIYVQDEQMVRTSAALTKRPVIELSDGCMIVLFNRGNSAKQSIPRQPLRTSALDPLQATNQRLDELYRGRSHETNLELDSEIDELEAKAAAIIAARSQARLQPLRTQFADALRTAKDLLGGG